MAVFQLQSSSRADKILMYATVEQGVRTSDDGAIKPRASVVTMSIARERKRELAETSGLETKLVWST